MNNQTDFAVHNYRNKLAAKRHRNPTEFKKARNFVNNLVNASRHKYFKQYFTEHSKDAKKVWEGIRILLHIEWGKVGQKIYTVILNSLIVVCYKKTSPLLSSVR